MVRGRDQPAVAAHVERAVIENQGADPEDGHMSSAGVGQMNSAHASCNAASLNHSQYVKADQCASL